MWGGGGGGGIFGGYYVIILRLGYTMCVLWSPLMQTFLGSEENLSIKRVRSACTCLCYRFQGEHTVIFSCFKINVRVPE